MHWVAETLSNLFADVFPKADDVARRSHLNDLAIVRHPIEGGVNRQAAFAEEGLDVERHLHVGRIHVFVLQDYRIEFQNASFFGVHGCKDTKKAAARRPRLGAPAIKMIIISEFVLLFWRYFYFILQ